MKKIIISTILAMMITTCAFGTIIDNLYCVIEDDNDQPFFKNISLIDIIYSDELNHAALDVIRNSSDPMKDILDFEGANYSSNDFSKTNIMLLGLYLDEVIIGAFSTVGYDINKKLVGTKMDFMYAGWMNNNRIVELEVRLEPTVSLHSIYDKDTKSFHEVPVKKNILTVNAFGQDAIFNCYQSNRSIFDI